MLSIWTNLNFFFRLVQSLNLSFGTGLKTILTCRISVVLFPVSLNVDEAHGPPSLANNPEFLSTWSQSHWKGSYPGVWQRAVYL